MTKHCQNCTYHISGNPPACNALHTPIAGDIDCRDWQTNEAIAEGLTPDGLYLRERLDQGQVPIAEIIQRQRSEQVERWREAFERGDPFGDLPEITHDPRGNLRIDRSEVMAIADSQTWLDSGGADWIRSIAIRTLAGDEAECVDRQADEAIARDTQRRADENESLREYYRIDRSSPAIALSELQTICSCYSNPLHRGQHLSAFRTTSERDRFGATIVEPITFTAIATPNGLKWQYQGAVIID